MEHGCKRIRRVPTWGNASPYKEFVHFTGPNKPWYRNRTFLEESIQKDTISEQGQWYWLLKDALLKTGLYGQVPLDFINIKTQPAVGRAPTFGQRTVYMRRKAQLGWKQYENDFTTTQSEALTALKPYLTRLKTVEKDKESSSSSSSSSSSAAVVLRRVGDRAKVQLQFSSTADEESADTRRWAYTFLLGGARPKSGGTKWAGGLYSVVAATHHLRKLGSRADVVLLVQITAESPHQNLPELEEEILQKMDIKVVYIPKFANSKMECFYSRKQIIIHEKHTGNFSLSVPQVSFLFQIPSTLFLCFCSCFENIKIKFITNVIVNTYSHDGEVSYIKFDGVLPCNVLGL